MKKFLVVMSFFLCFFVAIERVEAKSVSWSSGLLSYAGAGDIGESTITIQDYNVSVTYSASLTNLSMGGVILDGNTIPVGTQFKADIKPYEDTDISWFAVGWGNDSPFGVWGLSRIYAIYSNELNSGYYINFDPSSYSIATTGGSGMYEDKRIGEFSDYPSSLIYNYTGSTAGLSCDVSNQICTVTSPGTIIANISIGVSHYCVFPMDFTNYGEWALVPYLSFGSCASTPASYAAHGVVPAQTISFNLTAVSSNNAPSAPSVTPQPFNGNTNTAYPFTFTSTDPDNDQIAYEVDWNNDSLPDEGTPFVSSGTSQSLSNPVAQWLIAGTYSFKVRAKDNQGGYSPWTTPSVTLTTIVNGVCGLASGFSFDTLDITNLALCASGTQTNFLPTGTGWTWGCNGSGGGTSTLPNACTATTKTYTLSAVKNLGPSAAGTIIDTTPTAMSIDSAIPRNTESVPYNSSRTLRANPTSSSISWSGCASVSGNDCIVNNIIADKTVTATFTRLPEPGICGSSNTQSFETLNAGSSGLCSSGAVSGFSLSGTTYSWDCNGSFGSAINVSCSASQIRDYNWKEVRP